MEFRVFGPPGTGKTHWITKQVQLAARTYDTKNAAISSFTKAAAREIASRAGNLLPPENVGTLHALCYRLLGRPIIAETKLHEWSGDTLARRTVDVDDPYAEEAASTAASDALQKYNYLRNRCQPRELWPRDIHLFAKRWEDWLKDNDYIDFTGMIERCITESRFLPGIDLLFVDEAQDLLPLHWRLVRMWGEKLDKLIIVGDDDQTLYQWAGADPKEIIPGPDFPLEHTIQLKHSYRVPQQNLALAERVISKVAQRHPKKYTPREGQDYTPSTIRATYNHPGAIISHIQDTGEGTCMIIASCAYMLAPTLSALRKAGIPFWNPLRPNRGDWNPIKRVVSATQIPAWKRLEAFLLPDPSVKDIDMWYPHIYAKQRGLGNADWPALIHSVGQETKPGPDDWEMLFPDAHARNAVQERDMAWFYANSLASLRPRLEFPIACTRAGNSLHTPPRVVVGTVHSVKGGEADDVFIVPDLSLKAAEAWTKGDRDEILRIFYVAITRARNRVFILEPASTRAIKIL